MADSDMSELQEGRESTLDSDWSNISGTSPRKVLAKLPVTVHDWDKEWQNQKQLRRLHPVYDDGTMTFFWLVYDFVLQVIHFCATCSPNDATKFSIIFIEYRK